MYLIACNGDANNPFVLLRRAFFNSCQFFNIRKRIRELCSSDLTWLKQDSTLVGDFIYESSKLVMKHHDRDDTALYPTQNKYKWRNIVWIPGFCICISRQSILFQNVCILSRKCNDVSAMNSRDYTTVNCVASTKLLFTIRALLGRPAEMKFGMRLYLVALMKI